MQLVEYLAVLLVQPLVEALLLAATRGRLGQSYCVGGAGDHGPGQHQPAEHERHRRGVICGCIVRSRARDGAGVHYPGPAVPPCPGHMQRLPVEGGWHHVGEGQSAVDRRALCELLDQVAVPGVRPQVVVGIDEDLARIENIPRRGGVESDNVRSVKIREHGVRYEVDFSAGHKTGFFCDQRDNRKKFGALADGRTVLDLCCYTGGFGISAALAGASDVTGVDLDETSIAMAKRNANLNNARVKFTHADAFTWARTMIENGRTWDLVIADPPKFIHGREDEIGTAKYADLNKLALQLVAPEGLYVTCSCSGMLGAGEFERIVIGAAHRRDKRMQMFDRTGAGPDHPTLSNYPESRYLKVLWSRVI